MKNLVLLFVLVILIAGCSSSRLVDEYINKESPNFQAQKVLVVGLTPDGGLQRQFEYSLVKALKDKNIIAIKSVDYFKSNVNEIDQSEENLEALKKQLLNESFDAVLFSKIVGQENKVTMAQSYRNLKRSFQSFNDYYNENKVVYGNDHIEDYPVYNTETSLFCLCPGRNNDLIWRGKIDIVNPPTAATSIRDYVNTLMQALKKNNLLVLR
ncbi:hypothetical protein [Aequorivita xiaoshiensis]|uniref:Cardiolipin synthetase n=1 Tax=Aequorivita xiaoshiensis TaxID=2874476 RepID=A0A9X1U5C5_9FLAO|nr:hypothetical protein [Aequorivita xiaoshiensis]MCG2431880.1 hypothetical protein [Aequorivita xiaoshiensis]